MPFSPQTIDFLTMNRLNDSKLWFNEHKDDYRRFVAEPFREFTEKLLPEMQKIDPLINSVRISRIYRDARYSRGKSVFRENMWCTFGRTRELYYSLPCFYFDISANGFEYGCGFYEPARETMDAMREMTVRFISLLLTLFLPKAFLSFTEMCISEIIFPTRARKNACGSIGRI